MAMFKPVERVVIGSAMLGVGKGLRTAVATRYGISRTYAYTLMHKVEDVLGAFPEESFDKLIPVTDITIDRAILSLAMDCHASLEGIRDALLHQYNYSLDVSTISRKLNYYGQLARKFLETVDYSSVVTCAYDEVFQCGDRPILGVIDLDTDYIAELICTPDRTAETWAIVMMLLRDNQGLNFKYGISDFGNGLLAGVPMVFPNVRLQGDSFHSLMLVGEEIVKIENFALKRLSVVADLQLSVSGGKAHKKTKEKLEKELQYLDSHLMRADRATTLMQWLRELLAFPGYYRHEIKALILWVLDEMDKIDGYVYKLQTRTAFFRKELDSILEFHTQLVDNMFELSAKENIPVEVTSLLFRQSAEIASSRVYRLISRRLSSFDKATIEKGRTLVDTVIAMTHRASSMIECTNSRLRRYENSKHYLSNNFLALMRLYFNTKKIRRGEDIKKESSPLERLTGDSRGFFEILGLGVRTAA